MKSLKTARSLGPVVSSVEVVGINAKLVRCVVSAKNPDGMMRMVEVLWNPLDAKGNPLGQTQSSAADATDAATLIAAFFTSAALTTAETLLLSSLDAAQMSGPSVPGGGNVGAAPPVSSVRTSTTSLSNVKPKTEPHNTLQKVEDDELAERAAKGAPAGLTAPAPVAPVIPGNPTAPVVGASPPASPQGTK
jgi:hypothetical protein